ncbi:MAG: hypothetical protein M3Q19_06275 [Pseudomonadota bacterium]|nr:hypothetical protein [Pseudomonadota bacterium]
MAICKDQSLMYLRERGYNVIRHPRAGISPLDLIGFQNGETLSLGALNELVSTSDEPYPTITPNQVATDIEGQSTSKMKIGIGINLLGTLVGALGGTIGANFGYENAKKVAFQYSNVESDIAKPLAIGNYLREGDVDADNPILREYVMGNGKLYVLYHVVRSDRLSATFEKGGSIAASVDAGKLKGSVGGNVGVDVSNAANGKIVFTGPTKVAFGFKCLQIILDDGELRLVAAQPGSLALAVGDEPEPGASLLSEEAQLLDLGVA